MFVINLDIQPLLSIGRELDDAAKKTMREAAARLSVMTHAHIVESAAKVLHTRRAMYVEKLTHFQLDEKTFVVNLDSSVGWIEDGLPPHNQIESLLKGKNVKRAKDGSAYKFIPFKHNKGPTQTTPAQKNLLDTIKKELAARKIPYGKTENGPDGKPKLGLLHKFDIKNNPIKTHNGPGQGKGPMGSVVQGNTGIPLLQGIRVYQRQVKNKDGSSSVKRDIMSFRVVSSKHQGSGKWDHPGLPAVKLFDEAYMWAMDQWEKVIVPDIMKQLDKSL